MAFQKHLKKNNGTLCKSEMKEVLSVCVHDPPNTISWPTAMFLAVTEQLVTGVPLQIQFEILPMTPLAWTINDDDICPTAPGFYAYQCTINYIKVRVKPGTAQFVGTEEKELNHVIDGTEDLIQVKRRAEKLAKKHAEQTKKKADETNRFTGLEL